MSIETFELNMEPQKLAA